MIMSPIIQSTCLPTSFIEYVQTNHKLPMSQLWDGILKIIPNPTFTRKVISSMVSQINSAEWKRDPDELKSAKVILEEFQSSEPDPATGKKPLYNIESIPLHDEPGITAIAFSLPERDVDGRVREISLDSAWETNEYQAAERLRISIDFIRHPTPIGFRNNVSGFSTDFHVKQTLVVLPPDCFWVKFAESWREAYWTPTQDLST
ncbi:hypothetical protein B0H11DRAFT_2280533 [Mycena galericulata]|nr:hypothetical protein B0H11DRAFT_2280533 [Mycena galericulata]